METVVRRQRLIALALGLVLMLPIESWAGAFRPFETVDLGVWRIALFVVLPAPGWCWWSRSNEEKDMTTNGASTATPAALILATGQLTSLSAQTADPLAKA